MRRREEEKKSRRREELTEQQVGMEHNIGLSCDPIGGLVQIPCIERNVMGAAKAVASARLALLEEGKGMVSLDEICSVMLTTGAPSTRRPPRAASPSRRASAAQSQSAEHANITPRNAFYCFFLLSSLISAKMSCARAMEVATRAVPHPMRRRWAR